MTALLHVSLLFAIPCLSHKRLGSPTPRDTRTAARDDGPCGPVSWEEAYENGDVTEWTAGETVEVVVFQQIYHAREPMRLAISGENDEDFESCIWLNHIPQHTEGGNEMDLVIELTVPDMNCENCTLQLIGMQTNGRGEDNCCLYHPDCEAVFGNNANCCGGSQYYSCANINIVGGSRSRDEVCKQPNDWGFRDFKCNYFMAEESENAWTTQGDSLSLVSSGSITGLDPTAETHCSDSDLSNLETDCQSLILAAVASSSSEDNGNSSNSGAAQNEEMASLFSGGEMKGDGVFAVIVVVVLAIAITATYCLTKDKSDEGAGTAGEMGKV